MKQKILLIFILLLAIGGCSTEETVSSPTPAPSLSMELESTIPAPEPTLGIAERLQAVEEKLYLRAGYEYGGDDLAQDQSFLEYTGYQRLKTPPDKVKDYTRSYVEEICVETFRRENEKGERETSVLIQRPSLIQEFSLVLEENEGGFGTAGLIDANFDGYSDLTVYIGGRRGGIQYYALFLWDEDSGNYEYVPSFSHIATPKVDKDHRVIWGGSDFTFGYYYHAFELINGEFLETHSLIGEHIDVDWSKGSKCTEYTRINEEMQEVGMKEFPTEDLSGAVAQYIGDGPVWEGWTWCDPRAYERLG